MAYASCVRYREVLLLQGSPLLGAAFAVEGYSAEEIARLLVFAFASFLLVAHVFTFNDWAGLRGDSNDPNKGHRSSMPDVGPLELAVFSFAMLAMSLLLFASLPVRTFLLAGAITVLSTLYSHPLINGKGVPLLSSALHLIGGTLHFLLGYSLFAAPDRRGVLVALFFGLTFAAGHLNQEVQDHDGDRASGWSTNSVWFGKRPAFVAGFLLFTLAYAALVLLAHAGLVPPPLGWLAVALYPVQAFWSVTALRDGLGFRCMTRLRARYRGLYAILGLAMVVMLLVRF